MPARARAAACGLLVAAVTGCSASNPLDETEQGGDVVANPSQLASSPPGGHGSTFSPAARVCVLGFDLAMDAGLQYDSNTALEDADVLLKLARELDGGSLRTTALRLAGDLPGLLDQEGDEAADQIVELIADVRAACDDLVFPLP